MGPAEQVAIIAHVDVRRMLLTMRSLTRAARAICFATAVALDRSRLARDAAARKAADERAALRTPVAKAFSTDIGAEVASLGIQVHGGTGFIEETGAAQHLRDSRIAPIYEGTNGIQANDLVGRKLLRDRGEAARELIEEIRAIDPVLSARSGDDIAILRGFLAAGLAALETATQVLVDAGVSDLPRALAGSVPYLTLMGVVAGGWLMAKAALAAADRLAARASDAGFHEAKLVTARCYAEHVLSTAPSLLPAVMGGATVMSFDIDRF
jgi:3-(methylthio)propanoyl-CoA dehydrogenase